MAPLHEACRDGDTERVRQLLEEGAPVDEKGGPLGSTALMCAVEAGNAELVQLLLDKGAAVDEKNDGGGTALLYASYSGKTELVQLLLGKGARLNEMDGLDYTALMYARFLGGMEVVKLLFDGDVKQRLEKGASLLEKDADGMTLLMWASDLGHTDVVQLLLGKGVPLDEKDKRGRTALMWACDPVSDTGHTQVVQLLLGKNAAVGEKDQWGSTALMLASRRGHAELVQLLLGKGAAVDEKDERGSSALLLASKEGRTEVVQLLLDKGAPVDVKDKDGHSALPAVVTFDEEQLGRMAAAQVQGQLLKSKGQDGDALDATARAVLQLLHLVGFARERALKLRSSDPHSADDHQVLFGLLQLAAAACVQNDEVGKARRDYEVKKLFRSDDGHKALEHAVQIEAKELLAQPVVQGYIKVAWRGEFLALLLAMPWVKALLMPLLQLMVILPLVVLMPDLEPLPSSTLWELYLLRLPVVKFGLECAADLALALALTLVPASHLATAPIAPLLLAWVGSGLLREARQVMAFSSSDATLRMARVYDRLAAYWADSINRIDATALICSFAALVAFMSTDSENETATTLRAAAVFLLWLRVIRVLLISPKFGPFVMMFFRMLFGDVFYFMVLLFFVLIAFAASWTVLLEPEPVLLAQQFGEDQNWRWTQSHAAHLGTAGCADELRGVDILSTLLMLVEGALTGNDFFECARDSTKTPEAAWFISLLFVTLTSVLLLNMLIAMCAALRSRQTTKVPLASQHSCGAHLYLSCVLLTGWPRPLTTSRKRREPTTSSSSRRGRSLSRTSRRRRRR